MTRAKNPLAVEKEARLQEASAAVAKGEHTCYSAAATFHVPYRTLYNRVKLGTKPRNLAHEDEQILTAMEEKELVRWITCLTISGYPARHATVREMAEEIRKHRVKQINVDGVELIQYEDIGDQWVPRFLRCHSELSSVILRSIDSVRLKEASSERLQRYFDDLEKVMAEYKILPKDLYNMDESGFAIGEIEAAKCIINAKIR
jgi:hypothetical protein